MQRNATGFRRWRHFIGLPPQGAAAPPAEAQRAEGKGKPLKKRCRIANGDEGKRWRLMLPLRLEGGSGGEASVSPQSIFGGGGGSDNHRPPPQSSLCLRILEPQYDNPQHVRLGG